MFENTRWSNPNYQPNFDYGQRVQAAREGMWGANAAIEGLNLIGKGVEAYAQRKRVDDILKKMYEKEYTNPQTDPNKYFGVDSGKPASVPEPIAKPTSALLRAGESFTPSPVIPQTRLSS